MKRETARLQQIVGSSLADEIEAEFVVILRGDLPKATVIQREGNLHVEVSGSKWGTWPLNHPNNTTGRQRQIALEYLAAARVIEGWRAEQDEQLAKRREELANEFAGMAAQLFVKWENIPGLPAAIDRIIELERAASKV